MALQLGIDARNSRVAAIESSIGAAPKFQIRSGSAPANCSVADSGTLLVEMTLPSDWLNTPTGGVTAKVGTWQANAVAGGTAGHFRIKNSAGTVTGMQGTVGQGSGDLSLDNTSIASGQQVTITAFTLTDGNA